ncbi:hypothetical protein [Mycobacterium intracellulare]|nr:hypothetical protein [Mycobacterium intracellulare]BCO67531.1 hypothetical protein MINTM007_21420 [Mycobacterium intracellulare]BCO73061.1 hypothetical protein MINTM008_23960 [Mycobacterium intracellulare]BCO78502.1 hypothetical protein MINTM009_22840 [Mycobacterium intracellulare]BCP31479.1 hypothetical protein MINTM026_24490 [Mycobacterium intracellulare]BCP42424.1 hypothetical protein MINTMi27_25170 [Mycobacterium intracellulare]
MFEREKVLQLHNQGYCTAYISIRLGISGDYVRAVVAKAAARQAMLDLKPEAVRRARRAKAEDKHARALRLLEEADSVLEG